MSQLKERSANSRAMGSLAAGLGWIVIIGVVVYAEFAFLSIVSRMFPAGLGAVLASIGAVATGVSIIALAIMKATGDVHPGWHEITSWAALGIEAGIMGLNLMLSFAATGAFGLVVAGFLATWETMTAASPVAALVIWVLLMYTNPKHMLRHKQMELDDKVEAEKMEVGYETKRAQVTISRRYVARIAEKLDAAVDSSATAHLIQRAADAHTARILSELIGTEVRPQELRNGKESTKSIETSARRLPTKEEQQEIEIPAAPPIHQEREPVTDKLVTDEELENETEEEVFTREPEPEPTSPAPQKKRQRRSDGTPGRDSTDVAHALNWIDYIETGKCRWRNVYEFRKHPPIERALIIACRQTGKDFGAVRTAIEQAR